VETKIEAGEQKAGSKRCPWELCAIDESEEAFVRGAVECGGVEGLVREYYRQVRLLIESGLFDGLGHFDLVKIFNKDDTLFPQDSAWYRQAVRETLDVLAKSAMCMEINTNGWYKRIGEQYPSEWILRETRARNIAITLSSDGHRGDSVGRDLERAWAAAKKAGYETWVRFVQRKRVVCRAI
jgi:histidinol-phosphatase (PHP family)